MRPADFENVLRPAALAAVVAHSQIVVARLAKPAPCLPAGFDDTDVAVLEWIAAEGRRARGAAAMRM